MGTQNNEKLFWLFNAAGWLIYLLFSGIFFAYMTNNLNAGTIYIQLFAFCLFVICAGVFRHIIKSRGWLDRISQLRVILWLRSVTFAIALLVQFLISLFMMYVLHRQQHL